LKYATMGGGEWVAIIYKNGVAFKSGSSTNSALGANGQSHVSALVYLNGSSDYVEVFGYSDASMTIVASQVGSFFQAAMVRGA